jgi:cytochrome c biogenesis protein CcdA
MGTGATVAILVAFTAERVLFATMGHILWRDRGWKTWHGSVLGALLGFIVLIPWLISTRREERAKEAAAAAQESP